MRVICIDAGYKARCDGSIGCAEALVEGRIYTAIREAVSLYGTRGYILLEVKSTYSFDGAYRADRFIPLSSIDETEMVREKESEYVGVN